MQKYLGIYYLVFTSVSGYSSIQLLDHVTTVIITDVVDFFPSEHVKGQQSRSIQRTSQVAE